MTTVEAIYEKLTHLPPKAQEEILDAVERIEGRYAADDEKPANGSGESAYPLTAIAELAIDTGVTDLAERHDFYARGKLEG